MRARPWWIRLAAVAAGLVVVATAGAAAAVSRYEEQDPFCTSCHTVPEVTYYDRAQQALAGQGPYADLSSAHYGNENTFRCIDCHRGDAGIWHRLTTLTLGARDTAIWLSGRADPTLGKTDLVAPVLLTGACVRCHEASLLEVGFRNHFHNKLPEADRAWRRGAELTRPADFPDLPLELVPSDTTVLCVDCHRAHIHVDGAEQTSYLDLVNSVYPACVQCHTEEGHGPLELAAR